MLALLKLYSFTLTVVICDDFWSIFSVDNLSPRKDEGENIEIKAKEKKASRTEKDILRTLEQSIDFENNTKRKYKDEAKKEELSEILTDEEDSSEEDVLSLLTQSTDFENKSNKRIQTIQGRFASDENKNENDIVDKFKLGVRNLKDILENAENQVDYDRTYVVSLKRRKRIPFKLIKDKKKNSFKPKGFKTNEEEIDQEICRGL